MPNADQPDRPEKTIRRLCRLQEMSARTMKYQPVPRTRRCARPHTEDHSPSVLCLSNSCPAGDRLTLGARVIPRASSPEAVDRDKLAQVIGVVVGDQKRLAKNCLPLAMGDGGKQVRFRVWTRSIMEFRSARNARTAWSHAARSGGASPDGQ